MSDAIARSKPADEVDQARLLRIYLRDHEAAAAGGLRLVEQSCKANRSTPYGNDLDRLTTAIRADRESLRQICHAFDVSYSNAGRAIAVTGAVLSRLKTNGRAFTYSPLSRVIELEALSSGVMAKLRLWQSLLIVAATEPRLDPAELARHEKEANEQLDLIRRLHDMAVEEAFV